MFFPKRPLTPLAISALALSSLLAVNANSAIDPNDALHTLLNNGDFAKTTASWVNSNGWNSANDMTITATGDNYCVAINKKAAGAARWDFALRQEGLKLQAGHTYTVRGKVWSTTTAPAIYVGLDQTASPYANFKSTTIIPTVVTTPLTTNNLTFTYTHPATSADATGVHFGFQLGDLPVNTKVCFDDLVVYDPAFNVVVPQPLKTVLVNQEGYLTALNKLATYVVPKSATNKTTPRTWTLKQGTTVITSGPTIATTAADAASGEFIHKIDFSTVTATGTGFTLEVTEGATTNISRTFKISNDIYATMKYDALAYFYHNRSGITIDAAVVGAAFARGAGHLYDNSLSTKDGLRSNVDVSGGWYDAGDHGKYVVNGGISVWTLLNQYERAKYLGANVSDFADGTMKLPASEKTDGTPDLLNEARWEIEWMLKMQIPSGFANAGMVYHKLHDDKWTDLSFNPATATATANPRHIWAPTTAATYNFAAVGAQCYRTFKTVDAVFAKKCLDKAVIAYSAAKANAFMAAPKTDPVADGGGEYPDNNVQDESYWAATELYLATNDPAETVYNSTTYASDMSANPLHLQIPTAGKSSMSWADTASLGTISLATAGYAFNANATWVSQARNAIGTRADTFATNTESGFGTPFESSSTTPVTWGSNSDVLNNIIIMGLARDFSCPAGIPDSKLSNAIQNSMNYLMGRNPMDYSYITGYGSRPVNKPHHRFWNFISNVPAGVVVGGPNAGKEDPEAQANLDGCVSLECYIDNVKAYSTNEVTINWNSPLAWSAAYLAEMASGRKPQACGGVNAQPGAIAVTSGTSGTVDLKALNNGQTGDVYTIVTQPTKGTVTIINGVASYIGGSSFTSTDSFTYKITRGGIDSVVATVTVTKQVVATSECAYQITSQTNEWNNAWGAQLVIQNTSGAALTSWSVDLAYHPFSKLGAWGNPGSWDADILDLGNGNYRLSNKAWNGSIPAGGTLNVGLNGTAGPMANGAPPTLAEIPVISGTTCGAPLEKTVRFHSDHQYSIVYGFKSIVSGYNIRYFNNSTTPDDQLLFSVNSVLYPNFIHTQNCCQGGLFLEQNGVPLGPNTMTLSSGPNAPPKEKDTVSFLLSNARAECTLSNPVISGANWTATVTVSNVGYHPGSIARYYFQPALASDVVYQGQNWEVTLAWAEDYPGTGAISIPRNIGTNDGVTTKDGKARFKEKIEISGDGSQRYIYSFAPTDFIGNIAGRAANANPASYSFTISGNGGFYLPPNNSKLPSVSCEFGVLPYY